MNWEDQYPECHVGLIDSSTIGVMYILLKEWNKDNSSNTSVLPYMEIWESNDLRKVEMYFVEWLCLQGQSALFIEQSKQSVAKFEDDKQSIFS